MTMGSTQPLMKMSILRLCWCNWRTFEGKTPREGHKGVLFLHDNALTRRALAIQKKLPYPGFQCLHHPPCSRDLAPSDYHLFSELKKNIWKVAVFRPTRRSFLPRRPGWTDNILNFFWVACKSWSNGLKSVLSFVGSTLNKSRVWSLYLVFFLVGLRTYQRPLVFKEIFARTCIWFYCLRGLIPI